MLDFPTLGLPIKAIFIPLAILFVLFESFIWYTKFVDYMASIVKRLRPRIVVPICVGSNPTTRPIKKTLALAKVFFIRASEGENPQNA